jgi:hypothetical protein
MGLTHQRGILFLASLLLTPASLYAASGWTDYAPVEELTPTGQLRYLVQLKIKENPSGCKTKDTFYQDYDAFGAEQMFKTLLTAVAADKNVRVYVTGKCGLNGYAEISSVGIVP